MKIVDRLRERFQEERASLFIEMMSPRPGMRLLDLGGGSGSLAARIARQVPLEVTVADISDDHAALVRERGFQAARIDESGALPFAARSFDVVLCNSVIEHATMPKAACSVWFVQTPHRHFPIDQHVCLTPMELRRILPGAAIHVERFMGMPKSIVAWKCP